MRQFTTPKKKRQVVKFEWDGRDMTFKMPHTAPISMSYKYGRSTEDRSYVAETLDWLGQGLSEDDGQWVLDRLRDPDDALEVIDVIRVVQGLVEEETGRPTKPSPDSSE